MKRLLLALLLVVALSLTIATPTFAWGPPDNMPESSEKGLDNAVISMFNGFIATG